MSDRIRSRVCKDVTSSPSSSWPVWLRSNWLHAVNVLRAGAAWHALQSSLLWRSLPWTQRSSVPFMHCHRLIYRSEEHTSELQSLRHLVCRLLLEKKQKNTQPYIFPAMYSYEPSRTITATPV